MKKIIASIVVVAALSCMGLLLKASISKLEHQKKSNSIISSLPETLNKLNISYEQTPDKTMIVYFNSECEHCQWEIQEIARNKDLFTTTQLMFVSHEPKASALKFLGQYDMESDYLHTKPEHVLSTFSGMVPQLFIYNGEKLQEKFQGEVKLDLILEALQ